MLKEGAQFMNFITIVEIGVRIFNSENGTSLLTIDSYAFKWKENHVCIYIHTHKDTFIYYIYLNVI